MSDTQRIVIRIKKGADGRTSLSCTRADGTTTWQRQEGDQARFFPRHDLTHYAVETVLGLGKGFYGLVASGWDLSDFGSPWPRGRIPAQANMSELIVAFFDLERRTGERSTAEELNNRLAELCAQKGFPKPPAISEGDLARVRRKRAEVFEQWDAIEPGGALELTFDVEASEPAASRAQPQPRRAKSKKS
jgi:hypothetical protein